MTVRLENKCLFLKRIFRRDDVVCIDGFSLPKSNDEDIDYSHEKRKRKLRKLPHRNDHLRNDFTLPKEAYDDNSYSRTNSNSNSNNNNNRFSSKSSYDNQPPYECYWCCKPHQNSRPVIVPATPKPEPDVEEPISWTPFPSTRPTNNPVAVVWRPGDENLIFL
jgi:hypothetical protein